jgi:integrase/recombinase XerD
MTDVVALQAGRADSIAVPAPALDLAELVAAWLLTLPSEHSRLAYATDLGLRYGHSPAGGYRLERRDDVHGWLDHLQHLDVALLDGVENHVNLWRDHLVEAGYAGSTISRRLTAVSSLYGYLVRQEVVRKNPAQYAARPRINRTRVATYSPAPDDLTPILTAAEDRDPRADALVKLMTYTGLRVSEAVGADIEHLRTVRSRTTLTVTRKGGEVDEVPVPTPAVRALRQYLGVRETGPLFLSQHGGRLTRSRARDIVRSVGKRSGVTDRLTPHSLRHGYANGAESAGVQVTQIQQDLGHKSLATTQRYLHASRRHEDFGGHALAAKLKG